VQRQDRLRRDQGGQFVKHPAAQFLGLDRQATALVVVQAQPSSTELFSKNSGFLLEVVDDLLLQLVQPAIEENQQQSKRIQSRAQERPLLSRKQWRLRRGAARQYSNEPCYATDRCRRSCSTKKSGVLNVASVVISPAGQDDVPMRCDRSTEPLRSAIGSSGICVSSPTLCRPASVG